MSDKSEVYKCIFFDVITFWKPGARKSNRIKIFPIYSDPGNLFPSEILMDL